jgi:ribonuclease G
LAEWIIEVGIGETRAVLVEGGAIVEALVELEGVVPAGSVIRARLASVGTAARNAVARDESGQEFLLPAGAPSLTPGARDGDGPCNLAQSRQAARRAFSGDWRGR